MSDWLLPFGKEKTGSLTPIADAGMKDSLTNKPLTPVLDEGMAQSQFGIGSQVGTKNSIGRWQLPMGEEQKNQTFIDKLAAKRTKEDITKGTLMAQGIGEFIKSDSFKDYVRKLSWEE